MDNNSSSMINFQKTFSVMKQFILIITISLLFFQPCPDTYADDMVSEYISKMTLRQKVGQLILLGFKGKDLDSKDIAHIKRINPCGIVFYRRNFKDATDIAPLVSKIKSISNNKLPMFFAVDQESWIVHRIEGELYTPPSAPAIGATNSEELARDVGFSVGSALRKLGININLAPVLDIPADILNSPMAIRSFGNSLNTVETLGVSYIYGLKDAGLLATAKHFPGIGRAQEDTHNRLPYIKWRNNAEKESDVMPFASAIEVGVDMIMVGHVIAEPGDAVNPVSLSSHWMRDVLRKGMGFDGLIIVDNIEMKPIEEIIPVPEAAVKAFKAGADIIMVSHERKNQMAVFNALMNAVNRGDISVERLNESLRRIIEAKKKIMSYETGKKPVDDLRVLSRLVAENSVVALRLRDASSAAISKEGKVLYTGNNLPMFNAIKDIFSHAEILDTPLQQYNKIKFGITTKQFMQRFDGVIIDAGYPDAPKIISICNELHMEYVFVLHNPLYTLKAIEWFQPKRIVVTFENSKAQLHVATEIICGIRRAKGGLPYNIGLPTNYRYID